MYPLINVAICEDVPADLARLRDYVRQSGMCAALDVFQNGESFLSAYAPGKYDLIFMDIYMNGIDGIDTVEAVRKQDESSVIAFVTTSEEYALQSYRLGALKYLEKPVKSAEVQDTLKLAQSLWRTRRVITLPIAGKNTEVALNNILFIEMRNHAAEVHTFTEVLKISQRVRIDDIEALLPSPPFLRCHHSFIVNLKHVAGVDRDFLMKNGSKVYIRQSDIKKYVDAFKSYLLDRLKEDGL